MGITNSKRMDNYAKQNGKKVDFAHQLTPRQRRRIQKKGNQMMRKGE